MGKTDTLKEIIARKKERIAQAQQSLPEAELIARLTGLPPTRPFLQAVNRPRQISLIAEIKKQSPSQGLLREAFNPAAIAAVYQQAGAQAVSVLTEEDFFAGAPGFINEVKQAVALPVLRKDFILEPYQVYESRLIGADAILLIADILSKETLMDLIRRADALGMDCLVEVHDEKELKKVLGLKIMPEPPQPDALKVSSRKAARKTIEFMLGINNRNLRTLEVDLKTTERLYPLVPKDRVVVVESGIKQYQDVLFLKVLGVNAILVGEVLMRSADVQSQILDLMGW
ncbi:MAG TPA: indole-3-glycerol phosphate synthase TrpC [Candidatus Omnitrophota bacterium]|nr:indole-3-glycerol phosphate synthase TrpC [Candidatus Omnitrophota bacterium]HRZ14975.1 indole-3-glycerol phosphate synthase TrpC [Candidatus Omnitrophota bacterium]